MPELQKPQLFYPNYFEVSARSLAMDCGEKVLDEEGSQLITISIDIHIVVWQCPSDSIVAAVKALPLSLSSSRSNDAQLPREAEQILAGG